ncbi:MAG: DUF234 domain-containing protein [Baekduia sp.]
MTFIGREQELGELAGVLEQVAASGRGALVALGGPRRSGTTTLAEEFAKRAKVPALHIEARDARDHRQELERFAAFTASSELPQAGALRRAPAPESWQQAFEGLAPPAGAGPVIATLDEFPRLAAADKSVLQGLRSAWDETLSTSPVVLVLAGSDPAIMAALDAPKGPLTGRLDATITVGPLTPAEVAGQLELAAPEALDAHLITGGLPQLVACWKPGQTRKAFLAAQLADAQSPLVVAGERAMTADAPPQASARAVLQAIGSGETTFNRISEQAALGASRLSSVLRDLEQLELIEVRIPFGGDSGSKAKRYQVVSSYARFWMAFVEPSIGLLERGGGKLVQSRIDDAWELYREAAIEPVVRAGLARLLPDERFGAAEHVGGWWTRDGRANVDLVGWSGEGKDAEPAFAGAIAWGDRGPFGKSDLQDLAARRDLVPGGGPQLPLVVVSREGFRAGAEVDVALGPEELVAAFS